MKHYEELYAFRHLKLYLYFQQIIIEYVHVPDTTPGTRDATVSRTGEEWQEAAFFLLEKILETKMYEINY